MPLLREERSVGELLGELTHDMGTLVRQEVALAKTEMSDKISRLTGDLVAVGAGALVAWIGGLTLVAALVLVLVAIGVAAWLSALLVGGVLAGAGYVMLQKGLGNLKRADLAPTRTVGTLKADVQWAKEQRK